MDLIKQLAEKRARAIAASREIANRAAAGETLSGEDEAAWRKANADIDVFRAMMEAETRNRQSDAADEKEARELGELMDAESRRLGVGNDNSNKDSGEKRAAWLSELRKAIADKRISQSGADESLPDTREFLPTTRNRLAQRIERRAMLETGTATRGPELIPVTLVDRLFEKLFDDSTVLQAGVTLLRTDSGEALKFPRLASLGALSQANARVAEKGTIQKGEPTFDQVTLNAYKYAQISQATREVIQDSVIDIEGLLGAVIGRNMANYLGQDLTSGTGTNMPRGILQVVADTTANVLTGATGQTGGLGGTVGASADEYSKLMDVVWKLKPGYRRGGKFLVNDSTVLSLRKIRVNGEANNFAWQPGTADTPDTLLGYPILTDPYIPAIGLSNISIVFANFEMYYVRMVSDVRVEWSTEYAWDTDLVSVKAILRADGDAIDDTAFAGFKGAAT